MQLVCFALVLGAMAWQDRSNRALRYIAAGYTSGLVGALLAFADHRLPLWLGVGLAMEAAPVGYFFFQFCVVHLTQAPYGTAPISAGHGRRTLWLSALLVIAVLPFVIAGAYQPHPDLAATMVDLVLAVETSLSAWLLAASTDLETRWPRRAMAIFFAAYAVVEGLRVAVYFWTGHMPGQVAPVLEDASGFVYVVSCSVLPLAFIWMMNVRLHSHLRRMTATDPLTNLLNRRGLEAACLAELARAHRSRQELVMVLMDLDHFKQLNDTLGHPAGDAVLAQAGAFLAERLRASDIVGRLGGEEFLFLLPETSVAAGLERVERLRTALSGHFFKLDSRPVRITASFGIAAAAWPAATSGKDSWQQLLTEADVALYAAKNAGRNRTRTYHAGLEAATPPAQSATVAATAASLGPSSMNDSIGDRPSAAGL